MEQSPPRLVDADGAGGRRRGRQQDHGQLDGDHRLEEQPADRRRFRQSLDRPVRRPPGQRQAQEQQAHIDRPQRVDLPTPDGDQALEREDGPRIPAQSHGGPQPKAPTVLLSDHSMDAGAVPAAGPPLSAPTEVRSVGRVGAGSPSSPHRMARHRGHRPRSTADSFRPRIHSRRKCPARQVTRLKQEA